MVENLSRPNAPQSSQGIPVALVTEDQGQLVTLEHRVEATHAASIVFSHIGYLSGPTDPVLQEIQDHHAAIVIVDVNAFAAQAAGFCRDELGQEASNAGPLPQTPSPLTPEMGSQKVVVFLPERKRGQVRSNPYLESYM